MTRPAPQRYRRRFALPLLAAFAGCARVMAPPGGERDEAPPVVIATSPEQGSTIRATDEPVRIQFDERISERGVEDAVYVSPVTGAADATSGRDDIEVRIAGGWQPGRVYRVVVQGVVRDLFNNPLGRPIEIAFSTGAPFPESAVAGVVYERVTGRPVADARVEAHPVEGGAYHLALSDTGGVFRMPLLPPGSYRLRAYTDQNRDRRRDDFEPGDSTMIDVGATDTLLRPLALLRDDTSAANVTRVQVVDSITLRVQLDDYMDVAEPQSGASVRVRALPDSTPVALAGVWYPHALTAERARQDSIARERAPAAEGDSAGAAAIDTIAVAPPRDTVPRGAADRAVADTLPPDPLTLRVREAGLLPARDEPLPARELMVVLAQPLVPEAEYHLEVRGILNLAGVPGGGGTATFHAPAAPAPPAPPAATPPAQEDGAPAPGESAESGDVPDAP